MSAELKTRIEAGDLHFLDGLVLLGTIASQRWFAGKSRDVLDARVLDAGIVPGGPPILAFAIVEVRYGLQSHDLYHLPLGFRPADERWNQSVIAEPGGWTVYDAIVDPELMRQLVGLMRTSGTLQLQQATINFHGSEELLEPSEIRPMGVEQSNSSIVLDDRLVLKLFRRIEPGVNPELEVLRFLTERGCEHIAPLEGHAAYEGRPLEATLAILQQFVPAHGDGWEMALDTLASDPDWLPEKARRLGEVTALLHNALAADPADPHFAPEEPSTESLALLSASIDEEIESVFSALPETEALAPVRGRGEEVRDRLRALTHIGQVGRVIRTHGDFHLGQVLWTRDEDWLVLDFEGEPVRSLPERRRKRSPLRDVAGMLRSFAYVASAAAIQRGVEAPEGWEERCRSAFLAGYFATAESVLLPSGEQATERLLTVFELEKAVYELRYELHNRPDWVSIPVAGILRMLEERHEAGHMKLGELDLHLAGEGRHERIYERLGAHVVEDGVSFAVWAPNARRVAVVGDWNGWDGQADPLEPAGSSGIWGGVVEAAAEGQRYKFEVDGADGVMRLKADPFAFQAEVPPRTASIVHRSSYEWSDDDWIERRHTSDPLREPLSIYEVHPSSWRLGLGWQELAQQLVGYADELGFTHVELLPAMHHPFSGSWGYQVTGFYAPVSTLGEPDDFRAFVDAMHGAGIGVILDWVPAHFPRDEFALARFDGTALYEHEDPRRGAHPDWGTLVFNLGRNEVRNFLLANALFWVREYHADGLRVDAVASMLYLDYSRKEGQWVPNAFGGREDLEAVSFLKELNEVLHGREPGVLSIAEESTAWPGVSRPVYLGGLGFGFKWNMGWMHDTLEYFSKEPVHRRFHHHELTFSLVYAWNENFVLPLSHDEVVHGKRSLLGRMPGDRWQQFANLRALYGYMWAHPGKQLLFMGCEFAQDREWSEPAGSLDWHALDDPDHAGVRALVRDLNRTYRDEPALWEVDFSADGFLWLEPNAASENVLAFARVSADGSRQVVCVCNLSPVVRDGWRLGLPAAGKWVEVLNTDSRFYGGSDMGNGLGLETEAFEWHGQPQSAEITLPPLATVWLVPAGT